MIMTNKISQLAFDFVQNYNYDIENFIISSANEQAFNMIEQWPNWGNNLYANILLLTGINGCGKTHLAHIWQNISKAKFIHLNHMSTILNYNSLTSNCYIIENIDNMTVDHEEILFHIINHVAYNGGYLLITSSYNPHQINIKLADLSSRIKALPHIKIQEPDSELLTTILIKNFTDRQVRINTLVINYILNNIDRSFNELNKIIELIDKKSLIEKRNITIPLVKEILNEQQIK